MDVIKLNPSTYVGQELVRGWTNMVWTERFLPAGEFELRTPLVEYTRNLIPEDSLISLRDSREVMQVEDINIETNEEGIDEAVVTGRTVEAPFLEGRTITEAGGYRQTFQMLSVGMEDPPSNGYGIGKTPIEAAMALVWNAINNPNNWSAITSAGNTPLNRIPNVSMTLTDHVDDTNLHWWLQNGPLYPVVQDFLIRGGAGVRNFRPPQPVYPSGSKTVLTAVNQQGTILRYPGATGRVNDLYMDFYRGRDRTESQSAVTPVVFDWRKGHLDKPRYLFSTKNLMQLCFVDSPLGAVLAYSDNVAGPNLSGRARRQMYIEGGDQGDLSNDAYIDSLIQKGEIELAKYNRIAAMESAVTVKAPAKYKVDYDLGDRVTLRGNYGFKQTVMVSEYVRASDGKTEEGFPTLILPS